MEEVKEEMKIKVEKNEITDLVAFYSETKENAKIKCLQENDEDIKVKQEYKMGEYSMDVDIKLLLKIEDDVKSFKEENLVDNNDKAYTKELIRIIKKENFVGENNYIGNVDHDSSNFFERNFEEDDPGCREIIGTAQDQSVVSEQVTNCSQKRSMKPKKKYVRPLKFVCDHCGKRFTQIDILRKHIRIHTGEKPYKCKFCNKLCRTETLIKLHTRVHTGKPHGCFLCDKRFNHVCTLKEHMLTHENKRPFVCEYCPSSSFFTKGHLTRHIRTVHNKKETPIKRTSVFENEDSNSKGEMASDQIICGYCGKIYPTKTSLLAHINLHTKEKKFDCKVCGRIFLSKNNLRAHIKLHEDVYPYTCAECKVSFKSKQGLQSHFGKKHIDLKVYKCSECKASFKTTINLLRHIQIRHNNDKTPKFFCDICKKGFYLEHYLTRHKMSHTGSDKTFICDLCGIRCRSKTDIRRHIHIHMDCVEKSHVCNVCGKSFPKPSHLVRHLRVHSNKQPFQCTLCSKAYKDTSSWKLHIKSHSNPTFTCDDCGFCSISEQSFKRHMRSRKCKEFKYKCKLCKSNRRFKWKSLLKKHMEKSHGTKNLIRTE